ncbi:MAG: cohesin domain-containing protein [bacterium]
MTKIKFFFKSFLLSLGLLLASSFVSSNVYAAKLYLSPSDKSVVKDSEFEINLVIDTEGTNVFGSETKILYPSDDIELKSVSNGGFFSNFSSPNSFGVIEIHGFFSASFQSESGQGNFAVLKFQAKKDSGSSSITFDRNVTQILDTNGINILSGDLNQSNLTYTKQVTPQDTNDCGGTCGSNSNCNSNLFCYNGICRNASCPDDEDCDCNNNNIVPTKSPTTFKPNSNYTTTKPQIITLEEYSSPSGKIEKTLPVEEEEEEEEEIVLDNKIFGINKKIFYLGSLLILLILLVGLFKMKKKKTNSFIPVLPKEKPEAPEYPKTDSQTLQQETMQQSKAPGYPESPQETHMANPPINKPEPPNSNI